MTTAAVENKSIIKRLWGWLTRIFAPRDMTQGAPWKRIAEFAVPMLIGNVAQLLYNTVDTAVVGEFVGDNALSAVGSSGPIVNMLLTLFIGISTGANILAARYFSGKKNKELSDCVHTAVTLSVILGVFVAFLGFFLSTPMLHQMNTDPDVLPLASLYLKIYFLGVPATVVYNFSAAILRAIGDTERPLKFLCISGIVNVALNLVTVICFHMGVAGVAIATAVSQYVAAALVIICLVHSEGA